MKKFILFLLVLVAAGGVAVVTCPDEQAHKDAIVAEYKESLLDNLNPKGEDENVMASFLGLLGSGAASMVTGSRLYVENHFLFSKGRFRRFDGSYDDVSLGLFGHVFILNKEALDL